MTSREVIKMILRDGWFEVRQTGSHKHFKHKEKPGSLQFLFTGRRILPLVH